MNRLVFLPGQEFRLVKMKSPSTRNAMYSFWRLRKHGIVCALSKHYGTMNVCCGLAMNSQAARPVANLITVWSTLIVPPVLRILYLLVYEISNHGPVLEIFADSFYG